MNLSRQLLRTTTLLQFNKKNVLRSLSTAASPPSSSCSLTSKAKLKIKKNETIKTTGDPVLEDPFETVIPPPPENAKADEKAIFATKIGAGANVFLAISKGMIGVNIASTALIADAVNSLTDVLSDFVVYYTVTEARKRATPDRPWGLGKLEPIGALTVSGLLMGTGIGIGYSAFNVALELSNISLSIASIYDFIANGSTALIFPPGEQRAPIMHEEGELSGYAGLAISGLSIATKELLFRYTLKAGNEANSVAVIANAWQHRSDVITSMAVFAGLIGSLMGYPILDPMAGVLVAGVIIKQAYAIGTDSLRDLSDAPADATETTALKNTCIGVKGVLSVEALKARKSGPFLFVEATVGVDGNISASAAHRLAQLSRLELLKKHPGRVANAVVHVTPLGSSGLGELYPAWARDHDFIVAEIRTAVLPIKQIHSVSEVQVYYRDNGLISIKTDIKLPANLTIQEAHGIAVEARKAIEKALPGIADIDVDLELDEA